MNTIVVSASGKVLLAGGYLVLDQKYSGVVVSTSSRFYTVVETAKASAFNISVRSPQFKDAIWNYEVNMEGTISIEQRNGDVSRNKFVYIALQQLLRLAVEVKGYDIVTDALTTGLTITIAGDNDFYSQRAKLAELGLEPRISSLKKIPPFAATDVSLFDVHKTGLGSSAALITSLVAALFVKLDIVHPSSASALRDEHKALIHNTAQFIHCLAQGKVGSGFDVAAAVFGSQIYTRFNPSVISKLMAEPSKESLLRTLSPSNSRWDYSVEPFSLPPLVRLMLADVDAGSDTPSLVGKVLKWRETNPSDAIALWDSLASDNNGLAKIVLRLSELHKDSPNKYTETVRRLSSLRASKWTSEESDTVTDTFFECHEVTERVRQKMREMGNLSGVPVEPPEQTELLDACITQSGVLGGGVPGAGGYDAIWVIVLEPEETTSEESPSDRVEKVWSSWTKMDVSPLSASESHDKGIRVEVLEEVSGLREILNAV